MRKILIIDDNRMLRALLRKFFEKEKYNVTEAANGEEGLKYYKENPVDIVVTDIHMPGNGGLETIKNFQYNYPDTRIIAMTGNNETESEIDIPSLARKYGAMYVFKKPFKLNEMLNIIKKSIN